MNCKFLLITLLSSVAYPQDHVDVKSAPPTQNIYVEASYQLTQNAAFELLNRAAKKAATLNKKVSIAILDNAGNTILIVKGDGMGPHNTEAARRKAYTALSTKTSTLNLLRNANSNEDTRNLNTLPELLLLSGGSPVWYKGMVRGSIGVAGGGSPENDDAIARSCSITECGITTN